MAIAIDIGDPRDVHPKNKQDVGKRLALWPLAQLFGRKIVFSGPTYKEMLIIDDKIKIVFEYADTGLIIGKKVGLKPVKEVKNGKLGGFAIQGDDGKWYWAEAKIDENSVLVSHPEVKKPKAVRYAFSMNPDKANLYSKAGLPVCPFRTDTYGK